MSKAVAFAWALAAAVVVFEVAVHHHYKVELQSSECAWSVQLREDNAVSEQVAAWLVWFHKRSSSFLWMQLSVAIMFALSERVGIEMYAYVLLGHIFKNLCKSFMLSPRGFWFCESGKALHCGEGTCDILGDCFGFWRSGVHFHDNCVSFFTIL